MSILLLRILLLFLLPCVALAQNTAKLAGRVVDDLGDPLPDANVILGGTQLGASTDIDGTYLILGVPVGTYDVTALLAGYPAVTYSEVRVGGNASLDIDFNLGGLSAWYGVPISWEPPLIPRDPFASRRLSGKEIERLPVGR